MRQVMDFCVMDYAKFIGMNQIPHCSSPLRNGHLFTLSESALPFQAA